ncbi:lantibiotic dehydratase C-terminal domain-containing protein [Chitinimonas sp.]|uniref:lantibiotic dehydratase C-terminal domain-containing protein n=1 Tax=Chitinimonas sp. TaxID=1934313 RepID=UPI0035B396E8
MNNDWYCLHVFLSDHEAGTEFLLDWLQPKVRQLGETGASRGWFFLRYWHGGPHFRIRWKGLHGETRQSLHADAVQAAQHWSASNPPSREAYYALHTFDGQPEDVASLPWWDEGSVAELPYEPEWDRYGGELGTEVNEALFELSSNISLAVIRASQHDLSRRISLALPLMSASVLAFDPKGSSLREFFQRYANYWQAIAGDSAASPHALAGVAQHAQALRAQIVRIAAGSPAKGAEAMWVQGLQQAFRRFDALREAGQLRSPLFAGPVRDARQFEDAVFSMLSSQIHMMNNRLGFAPAHEYLLAQSLIRAADLLRSQDSQAQIALATAIA